MSVFDMLHVINCILYDVEYKFSELRHVGEFEYEVIIPRVYYNELIINLIITPYDDGDDEFDIFTEDILELKFQCGEYYISKVNCKNDYSACDEILIKSCEKTLKILMNNEEENNE